MDLLSGLPKEVANNLMEHSKGILEVDEFCAEHPRYKKLMLPDGKTVCPVCYKDQRDNVVSKENSEAYYAETAKGRRKYLYKNSVVSNKFVLDKGFKTYFTKTESEKRIREDATLLVEPLASGDAMTVYLQGAPGCGKTHLASSMIKNVNALANGKRCLFMNFPML
uniref:hypothetical protein n=1 Tax=uncultured Enterococcus sp. TaxID=167972 RepID=UPI002AA85E61